MYSNTSWSIGAAAVVLGTDVSGAELVAGRLGLTGTEARRGRGPGEAAHAASASSAAKPATADANVGRS